ncbi:glycerophosphodiester phosphodiesterase [Natronorarus salvus]|uniref:glycerophosphodiester phosphodiesterase n=1 Tax=Natronorarus salvus TaxID=3117733 RepID=UPI002F26B5B3
MSKRASMLNRRRFVSGVGAAAVGAAVGSTSAGASEDDEEETGDERDEGEGTGDEGHDGSYDDRATVIAHRGFADTYPENTIAAFEQSTIGEDDDASDRRAADWIELDVFPTCDGEIAVFHDEDLSDLTDTEGLLYETPAETVFSAEVLESGQTVPSLAESMEAIPDDVGVNVDIKNGSPDVEFGRIDDPGTEREEWAWLETVIDVATDYENELLLSTFWEGALATVREIDPDIPAAYLLSASIQEGLDVTDEYDCEAINPPLSMILGTPFFDDDFEEIDVVAEAHDRGVPVNAWTINEWYEVERLIDAGVDGLFLDYAEIVRFGALSEY